MIQFTIPADFASITVAQYSAFHTARTDVERMMAATGLSRKLAGGIKADQAQVIIPLHPRGRARLEEAGFLEHPAMRVVDPLGYLEFMGLVSGASAVVTDSGGVQEETTILGIPCLTLRPNTERPVTITHGTNQLVTRANLADRVREVLSAGPLTEWPTPPLWDGAAGERIADVIVDYLR